MAKAVTGHTAPNLMKLRNARRGLLAGLKAVEISREHLDSLEVFRVPMKDRPQIHMARLDLVETTDDINSALARIDAQIELGPRR